MTSGSQSDIIRGIISVPIEQVSHPNFLGVVIYNKLDGSNHISHVNGKIANMLC